jgi:hypothetical protein
MPASRLIGLTAAFGFIHHLVVGANRVTDTTSRKQVAEK